MRYLSIDIEATGLNEKDYIIEFAMVPVCTDTNTVEKSLGFHRFVKCPTFEELRPNLDEWVINHNKDLIIKANQTGVELNTFKKDIEHFLNKIEIREFFNYPDHKIIILGKSLNAIDLPFLNRDLGWHFMRTHFHHQVLDVSSVVFKMIDNNQIPIECKSGSYLSSYLNLGDVDHTALEDAIKTAEIYLKLLEISG